MATTRSNRRNQVATQEVTNDLKVITVKQFCAENNFVQVNNEVKTNVNGYPFVTFINKDNKAENIYFSKEESLNHKDGDPISVSDGFFDELQIAYTKNAEGEERIKLVGPGSSMRESLDDLM